jgi:hypothetical protein
MWFSWAGFYQLFAAERNRPGEVFMKTLSFESLLAQARFQHL